jgi:uncharacterized protein (DUF433 family)
MQDILSMMYTAERNLYSLSECGGFYIMQEIFPGITADAATRFGKPVIKGTRVPIDLLVGKVGGGMSIEAVAEEYDVTPEDVLTALRYAAQRLTEETIYVAS